MRPFLTVLALCAALTASTPAQVQLPPPPRVDVVSVLDPFIWSYHRQPARERVPGMLDLALVDQPGFLFFGQSIDVIPDLLADRDAVVAHALGWMARGDAQLVRQFEARFAAASAAGRTCILTALRICGDEWTHKQLDHWAADPRFAANKAEIEATRIVVADAKRLLPRDRPVKAPGDLDALWADFFVTGAYAPISRILDTLDQPDSLREPINKKLSAGGAGRAELLAALSKSKLTEPGAEDRLIAGDLDLVLLHDRKGRLSEARIDRATKLARGLLKLPDEEWQAGIELKVAASWSLQSFLKDQPRLVELLTRHVHERPTWSRDLVKKWLRLDQPKVELTAEMQALQGSWMLTALEDGDTDADLGKMMLELILPAAWTFDADEVRVYYKLAQTADGKIAVKQPSPISIMSYSVDANQRLKLLNLTPQNEDCTDRAIYEIDGDTLRICVSAKDAPLPKEFSTPKGSGRTLFILKKAPQ